MMYDIEILPIYNFFKAEAGELKYLYTNLMFPNVEESEYFLSEISDKYAEITGYGEHQNYLYERSKLSELRCRCTTITNALECLKYKDSDTMVQFLEKKGFNIDIENKQASIDEAFNQLEGLIGLYNMRCSEMTNEGEQTESISRMNELVSYVENNLPFTIDVEKTPILKLAYHIRKIKDNERRAIKSTSRTGNKES